MVTNLIDDAREALLAALLVERFAPLPTPEPDNLDGPSACAAHLMDTAAPVELADVVPLRPRRAA